MTTRRRPARDGADGSADLSVEGRGRHVLTAGLLSVSVLSFAANAVFSRLLGRSSYGAVGSVLALATLLAVPLSAVQSAVTRQVAVAPAGALRLGRPILLAAGGAAALVCAALVLVPVLDPLLHLSGDWAVALCGAYLGAILLEGVPRGALVGERRYAWVGLAAAGGAALRLAVGWVWVALRPGIVGPLAGAALGEVATALVLLALVLAASRPGARSAPLQVREVGLSVLGFTGLLSLMSIDTVAARHWLSPQASGYYAAASAGGSIAYFVSAAAATSIFPDVARGASSRDGRAFRVGLAEVAALALGTAGVLCAAAPLVVLVVFGHRYAGATVALRVLSISYALLGISSYLVSHHLAHRSAAVLLPWAGAGALVAAVVVAHGSTTSVALDALAASGALLAALAATSVWLERHAAPVASRRGRRIAAPVVSPDGARSP